MADDTPTVGEANRALLIEISDCLERAFAQQGKGSGRIVELIDALIAAVRAERDAPVTHCRHCGRACQVDECLDCWRQRQPAR